MDYDNKSGTIRGTGTNNALVINLGQGTGLNEAAGNIAATGAGGLILTSGYFTNNGTMAANNGSAITFQSGAVDVNLAEGDLVGGHGARSRRAWARHSLSRVARPVAERLSTMAR